MFEANRRMERIFAMDGRALIVAYDHGATGANHDGMRDPARTLPEVIQAGADAILTTIGIARRFEKTLARVGLCLNLDGLVGPPEYAVQQAMKLGADMGKAICTPWSEETPDSVAEVRRLAAICQEVGLPLMVETIPVSFQAIHAHTPEKIAQAARIGCELGADLLKVHYTGDVLSFREVLAGLFRPVVILGGARQHDTRSVLESVAGAMEAGAVGVAIGRNIWGYPRPGHMVAAIGAIVHGGATVDQAMREMVKIT